MQRPLPTIAGLFGLVTVTGLAGCTDDHDELIVGQLESDRVEITADASEPIVRFGVAEGESVSAGDVIAELRVDRALARRAEAAALVAEQQARLDERIRGPRSELLDQARAALAGARDELAFREAEYERIRQIRERGLASAEELDRASAAVDAARSTRAQQAARLEELLAGTTVEELAQAEQALARAQAQLDAADIDVERHTLRAPVDGIVDRHVFEVGERPPVGKPVAILLGGDQPHARVYVPERLRAGFRPGLAVAVIVDGRDESLDGRVRWVASEAGFTPYFALTERDRGRLSYVAKIDLPATAGRLPDGVPVEVRLRATTGDE